MTTSHTARDDIAPYDTYATEAGAVCDYCDEGCEIRTAHEHAYYVSRDGAASRTADNLCAVFLDDVASLTTYAIPTDLPYPDASEWCDDSNDSQALHEEATYRAESALCEAGFMVTWNDGYIIERLTIEGEV